MKKELIKIELSVFPAFATQALFCAGFFALSGFECPFSARAAAALWLTAKYKATNITVWQIDYG